MFGLIKNKTGIKAPVQIRHLEYIIAFKKERGRIKISSVLIKKKIFPCFERVSEKEINFSGASKDEFLEFLRNRGARQIEDSKRVLEYI
jgi:hypothetical protein